MVGTIVPKETFVATLTVGQLMDILSSMMAQTGVAATEQSPKNYVYGLRGIQDLFQCSHTQAQRYKDGLLKPAVIQSGRKIIVDADKAMELFNQNR